MEKWYKRGARNEELTEAAKEHLAHREQEGAEFKPLVAEQLSSEIKKTMGLDVFPEHIQNDLLALSQKIADYMLEVVQQPEEERRDFATKLADCMVKMPTKNIWRDATKAAGKVWKYTPPSYKLALTIGAFGASLIGAAAGHTTGCILREPSARPPIWSRPIKRPVRTPPGWQIGPRIRPPFTPL